VDLGNTPISNDTNRFPIDRIGLILGPALLIGWLYWAPANLATPEAHRLAGILLLTITWWLTEPIPIAATGLVAVALTVFLGAVPVAEGEKAVKVALAPFGDPTVFFLMGGMFIGRAMERHGLDRRIALSILTARWASRSPSALLVATGLAVMLVSMWISNTAATAMVYPVTLGIIGVLSTGSGENEAFDECGRHGLLSTESVFWPVGGFFPLDACWRAAPAGARRGALRLAASAITGPRHRSTTAENIPC